MGMYIYSREKCVRQRVLRLSPPAPLTDTNNVHEDAASCLFEAASGNRR